MLELSLKNWRLLVEICYWMYCQHTGQGRSFLNRRILVRSLSLSEYQPRRRADRLEQNKPTNFQSNSRHVSLASSSYLAAGQRFKIYEADMAAGDGQPGQILSISKKELVVAAGQGSLSLKTVQPLVTQDGYR